MPNAEINAQEITLVRKVVRHFGKKRQIFWYGGGQCFMGYASHMRALSAARKAAEVRVIQSLNRA